MEVPVSNRLACVAVVALAVSIVMLGSPAEAQQAPKELQGTWEGLHSTGRGKVREFKPGETRLVFAGDKLSGKGIVALEERQMGFAINLNANPKQIDYWDPEAPNRKFSAIYKVEGDTLTLAIDPSNVRPTTFSPEATTVLLVLKRRAD
jgi:uncharacterized protein (TIGR03067 family)